MRSGNIPRTIHILGHHDTDGIVSAALAGAYLRDRFPEAVLSFGIVDFHLRDEWRTFETSLIAGEIPGWERGFLPEGIAIVDFPAPSVPENLCLFYADHHQGSFRSLGADEALEARYAHLREGGAVVWHDPGAPSCVAVILRELEVLGWEPPPLLRTACDLATQIDSASYPSARDAVDHRASLLAAVGSLCLAIDHRQAAHTADLLSRGHGLHESLIQAHEETVSRVYTELDAALKEAAQAIFALSDEAVAIDWTATPQARTVRFAEYFFSSAAYAARLEQDEGEDALNISISRSPWASPPEPGFSHPNMGRIAERMGGGGHPYAAGFRVDGTSLEETRANALAKITSLVPFLRQLPVGHPLAID